MASVEIRGTTKLIALLGNPVAHSLSPQIHNTALAYHDLPFAYVALPVRSENLHTAILSLRQCGFAGANVTIPHKQSAIHYCDILSPLSATIGAVNTLYFKNNALCGTSTDPAGFFRALAFMRHNPAGGNAVVLGSGGTARTLGFALALDGKVASLTIAGRSIDKVKKLACDIESVTGKPVALSSLEGPTIKKALSDATLLVNCTSVGMNPESGESPLPENVLHAGVTVFDAIYAPAETRLLAMAKKCGCPVQNGLRMLVYQALESFKYWTGVDVDERIYDLYKLQQQVAES